VFGVAPSAGVPWFDSAAGASMSTQPVNPRPKRDFVSAELFIAFVGAVVLFLIGPAIPKLIDQYRGADELRSMVDGPVYFDSKAAYSVEVQNRGRAVERNVEIWLPAAAHGAVEVETDPFDFSERPPLRLRDEKAHRVAILGDLHPGESQRISVITAWTAPAIQERGERFRHIPHILPQVKAGGRPVAHQGWKVRAFQAEMRTEWYRGSLDLMLAAVAVLVLLLLRQSAPDSVAPDPPGPRVDDAPVTHRTADPSLWRRR
jgi:hypothetical protein